MRVFAFIVVAAACSGSGVTGAAPAQALLKARFDTQDMTDCSIAGSAIGLGTIAEMPIPVQDGSQGELGVNHIACKVVDLGNQTFRVEGTMMSDDRLLFAVKGTFPMATDKNGFKADSVTVSNGQPAGDFAAFTESDGQCSVLYNTTNQGATTGRVWAEVTCAKATKDPAVGGKASGTCTTISQFRFEDCARQ